MPQRSWVDRRLGNTTVAFAWEGLPPLSVKRLSEFLVALERKHDLRTASAEDVAAAYVSFIGKPVEVIAGARDDGARTFVVSPSGRPKVP